MRNLNLGEVAEQGHITDQAAFALDWIDGQIGQGEYRYALIVYVRPVSLLRDQTRNDDAVEHALLNFSSRVSEVSAIGEADFLRHESQAAIIGWFSFTDDTAARAATVALQLASWKQMAFGASCAVSIGRILLSNRKKQLSDCTNVLSGGLFEHLGRMQVEVHVGCALASRAFVGFCTSKASWQRLGFCFKSRPETQSDFLELQQMASNVPQGCAVRQFVEKDADPAGLRRSLAAEKQFLSFGECRRFLSVAAVGGRTFDCQRLARCLSMEPAHIADIVRQLRAASAIRSAHTTLSEETFCFADDALHEVAYRALPLQARTWLHDRIAHSLVEEKNNGEMDIDLKAVIAWHFAQSGKVVEAGTWSRTAAQDAVVLSAPDRAIAYLRLAYQSLKGSVQALPDAEWAGLYRLLGTQLATVHGNASPAVLAAYQHGLDSSADNIPSQCETDFDGKWGLAGYYLTRGELANARLTSRSLIAIAERHGEDDKKVLAVRMAGLTELLLGNLPSAIFNFQMCISSYDFERHNVLCHQYGSDQLDLAHAHLAWALALNANAALSRKHAELAFRQANILQHSHTSAHVAGVLSLVYEINGQWREAHAMDLACATLACHHKFPYWEAWSDIV